MTSQRLLKASVFAGYLMLSNGAETSRTEDTVARLLKSGGVKNVEVFATITAIIAGFDDEGGASATVIKRIRGRGYNLSKIAKINDISRSYVNKRITLDEMESRLRQVENEKSHSVFVKTTASAFSCFCFSYMLGQNFLAAVNAFFIGLTLNLVASALHRRNLSPYLVNLLVGCTISAMALIFVHFGFNQIEFIDKTIIGSILPYLPGIAMTNAIRDILDGDYISGVCLVLEAVFVVLCLSGGVGLVLGAYMLYAGGGAAF